MLSERTIKKIQELKAQRFNTTQIARTLKISRPTVLKYLNNTTQSTEIPSKKVQTPLTFDDLFEMDSCGKCRTNYPMPKFLPKWQCPYCKATVSWTEPCFNP